jgi:hypothetical protein
MLGADMSRREDSELELPLAAVPPPPARSERTLTANIHHDAAKIGGVHVPDGSRGAALNRTPFGSGCGRPLEERAFYRK